jgi:hypothetical protein
MFAHRRRVNHPSFGHVERMRSHTTRVFQRTADILEESARLADFHAEWEERAGHHDVARDERSRAAWARHEAQRARQRANGHGVRA